MKTLHLFALCLFFVACRHSTNTYQDDLQLLKQHSEIIELINNNGQARLMIMPKYQGKIVGSTADGLLGDRNGWLNRKALAAKDYNGIGGEDRVWIGPLGGQYSLYYQQIEPLDEGNWKVPTALNQAFEVVSLSDTKIEMQNEMHLCNFKGSRFDVNVKRTIKLLSKIEAEKNLAVSLSADTKFVAFESAHVLTNMGGEAWRKESGLLSLWSLNMLEGSENTVVIIPLKKDADLQDIYQYLGLLDSTRLRIRNNVVLFKADGKYRSKIGIPPQFAPSIYASYSKEKQRLSIVQYQKNSDSLYFNSNANIQENPYKGEVIPVYNNGSMDYSPTSESSFYELESCSPMRELQPGDSLNHFHRVYHFSGKQEDLNKLCKQILGVGLPDCNW
ncbi:DUF6786 family protein [Labilibaculum antarcticum]|uniref:Lipoprotein n=1 Tax=Labilibaculum antarcticum TaxID=1717717 RepID=A0A1Y1CDN9_9BACT|nr:DUF6786 family protein [Labilibaculum antarcticum]BAX78430.1 hypothetical protein ALGA_0035 [Labilibaculum antarcticum]